MTKILLIGASLSGNFGGPSLLSSTVKVLNKFIPRAKFTLLSPVSADCKLGKTYGIKVVSHTQKNGIPWFLLRAVSDLNEYKYADIIIDIWGIGLGEGPKLLLASKLLNKPVIKYTADMGPFKAKRDRLISKIYLNNIDLIFARSETTKKHLLELGVTTPIYLCPDTAFILEPTSSKTRETLSKERLKKRIVAGISTSHITERKGHYKNEYVIAMAKTADYLIQRLDALVVLVPNEMFPKKFDDLDVAKRIFRKINDKTKVILLEGEYSASQLKGIIGEFDLLVGARYHSIVAAISMCVPTLAVSWHHKYHEVMKLMSQEEYVCDIKSLNFAELQEKIDRLRENREKIKAELASRMPFIMESVFSGGKMIKDMLNAEKKQ
jgi:polysaccharide pyruvyl transferase WcaK-like protein